MKLEFIPDLRDEGEKVTTEHISTLQERFAKIMDEAHPNQGVADAISNHFDPEAMKEEILDIFTEEAFLSLFKTEMGKGILLGAFYQAFIDAPGNEEDAD